VILVPALIVILAACGGSDDGGGDTSGAGAVLDTTAATESSGGADGGSTETTAPDDAPDEGAAAAPEQAAVGDAGSFTVNGTEFAVTFLNRCIPFQDESGNIDLQALGQGGKLDLYLIGEFLEVSVDGLGIEEMFGSIAFGADPVIHESIIDGDRWMGSATVGDSLGSGDPVDITWNVMIPAEAIDCSL
jgi:hypothetical protein